MSKIRAQVQIASDYDAENNECIVLKVLDMASAQTVILISMSPEEWGALLCKEGYVRVDAAFERRITNHFCGGHSRFEVSGADASPVASRKWSTE